MGAEKTDEELMLAYAQGDVRAFDALYQRQRGMLYRFILRSVHESRQRRRVVSGDLEPR